MPMRKSHNSQFSAWLGPESTHPSTSYFLALPSQAPCWEMFDFPTGTGSCDNKHHVDVTEEGPTFPINAVPVTSLDCVLDFADFRLTLAGELGSSACTVLFSQFSCKILGKKCTQAIKYNLKFTALGGPDLGKFHFENGQFCDMFWQI